MANIKDLIDLDSVHVSEWSLTATLQTNGRQDRNTDFSVGDVADHFCDYLRSIGGQIAITGHNGQYTILLMRTEKLNRYKITKCFPIGKSGSVDIIPDHDSDKSILDEYKTHLLRISNGTD